MVAPRLMWVVLPLAAGERPDTCQKSDRGFGVDDLTQA